MFAFIEQRNQALLNWAEGDLHCMAAVILLNVHGYWPPVLDQASLLETWNEGPKQFARPMLVEAIATLEDPHVRTAYAPSSTQADILYIAASLAFGHPINLSRRIERLDRTNSSHVVAAIRVATRLEQV